MKLRNHEIESFVDFLMEFELKSVDSRQRTRLCKVLIERTAQVKEDHAELLKEFANFNEDGTPVAIFDKELGREVYDIPEMDKFRIEYGLLMTEEFIIDNNEERKEMLLKIREIVLNCETVFKGKKAFEYDRWCEIVETITYED